MCFTNTIALHCKDCYNADTTASNTHTYTSLLLAPKFSCIRRCCLRGIHLFYRKSSWIPLCSCVTKKKQKTSIGCLKVIYLYICIFSITLFESENVFEIAPDSWWNLGFAKFEFTRQINDRKASFFFIQRKTVINALHHWYVCIKQPTSNWNNLQSEGEKNPWLFPTVTKSIVSWTNSNWFIPKTYVQ